MVNARRGTALPLHKSWGRQLPLLPPPVPVPLVQNHEASRSSIENHVFC